MFAVVGLAGAAVLVAVVVGLLFFGRKGAKPHAAGETAHERAEVAEGVAVEGAPSMREPQRAVGSFD